MIQEVTTTLKVHLLTSDSDKEALADVSEAYRSACDYISDYVFKSGDEKVSSLHRLFYRELRDRFGLKSQFAESVLKTVLAKYATVRSNSQERTRIRFRTPQCDLVRGRDWSYTQGMLSVNTLRGRPKLPFYGEFDFADHGCRFGGARLLFDRRGEAYLLISVTREVDVPQRSDITSVVGIDRGIRKTVVAYDGKNTTFVQGKSVKNRHAKFLALRRELQQRGTPSARHRLKKIGQRENRWMGDVNHCIARALVDSNPKGTLFVLEDLKGVRGATERVKTKNRYVTVCWSYYDLEQKLTYKARLAGQEVLKVSPEYTSQRCPVCGSIDKHSRDKKNHHYRCTKCGYRSDDDRIGAMNLYQLGLEYLNGTDAPKIQSPSGKPGSGGRRQPSRDVTSRRKATKGGSCKSKCNAYTTGELQAHRL